MYQIHALHLMQQTLAASHNSQPVSTGAELTLGATDALKHLLALLKLATLNKAAKEQQHTLCHN